MQERDIPIKESEVALVLSLLEKNLEELEAIESSLVCKLTPCLTPHEIKDDSLISPLNKVEESPMHSLLTMRLSRINDRASELQRTIRDLIEDIEL